MSKAKTGKFLEVENPILDAADKRIIEILDGNARLPVSEIARTIAMSAPSVADRIRSLEEAGIIRGFTLEIDAKALGYAIQALVRIRPLPGKLHLVERLIQETPQFIECDKITGDDPFLGRLVVRSIEEMDEVLEKLSDHAVTSTAVIKGKSVNRRLPPM